MGNCPGLPLEILHAELSVDPDLNASSHSNFTEILVIQICDLSCIHRQISVSKYFIGHRKQVSLVDFV